MLQLLVAVHLVERGIALEHRRVIRIDERRDMRLGEARAQRGEQRRSAYEVPYVVAPDDEDAHRLSGVGARRRLLPCLLSPGEQHADYAPVKERALTHQE